MSSKASSSNGKKGGNSKSKIVFTAYAENKETAEDWYHVLCEDAGEDEDDDEQDDDDDDDDDD